MPLSDLALGRAATADRLVAVVELLVEIAARGVERGQSQPPTPSDARAGTRSEARVTRLLIAARRRARPPTYGPTTPAWVTDTSTFVHAGDPASASIADRYRDVAAKIIAAARADRGAYDKLAELTDTIGHRLSGSARARPRDRVGRPGDEGRRPRRPHREGHGPALGARRRGRGDHRRRSRAAPCDRPRRHASRRRRAASPRRSSSSTTGTSSRRRPTQVKGAIVVYNVAMPAWTPRTGSGYGETVAVPRRAAPSRAAKHGAVAVARALGDRAQPAHAAHRRDALRRRRSPKIPTAAITVEDAELLDRLAATRPGHRAASPRRRRRCPTPSPRTSSARCAGSDKPDEIVRDRRRTSTRGTSGRARTTTARARDDDAGAARCSSSSASSRAARSASCCSRTRRTACAAARATREQHAAELAKHVLALESDSGGFAPRGFGRRPTRTRAARAARTQSRDRHRVAAARRSASRDVARGHGGADIGPMDAGRRAAWSGSTSTTAPTSTIHHTEADTLDKVDPAQLADDVAAVAVLAYVVADLPRAPRRALSALRGRSTRRAARGAAGRARLHRALSTRSSCSARRCAPGGALTPIARRSASPRRPRCSRGGAAARRRDRRRHARAPRAEAERDRRGSRGRRRARRARRAEALTTAENARFTAGLLGPRRAARVARDAAVSRPRSARLFRRAGLSPRVWHIADSLQYRDRVARCAGSCARLARGACSRCGRLPGEVS